jgi:hypothetical protein
MSFISRTSELVRAQASRFRIRDSLDSFNDPIGDSWCMQHSGGDRPDFARVGFRQRSKRLTARHAEPGPGRRQSSSSPVSIFSMLTLAPLLLDV